MTTRFAQHASKTAPTPQSEPIPDRAKEQVKNDAGGFVFALDDWKRLDRFLVLGSEGGTYYATERKLTLDNAECVKRCLAEDGVRVVNRVVEISHEGRAPKNDPALFVLALAAAHTDVKVRQAALAALPKVARIGTHIQHFAEFAQGQRGWGRGMRRAVSNWYLDRPIERLADQVSKYQQRDGWANRDLLRLAHPGTKDPVRAAVFDWICGRKDNPLIPAQLKAIDDLHKEPTAAKAVEMIHDFDLPRECIPTQLLNDADVWAALLENMPLGAMVRNLGKMSSLGVLKPMAGENLKVTNALKSEDLIKRARLHPVGILLAQKIYAQGKGDKGSLTWTPVQPIVDALDDAFYLAFKTIVPTGKRILIALDVSGSMSSSVLANSLLTAAEGAAAMAMSIARSEPNYYVFGFSNTFKPLAITAKTMLKDALKITRDANFGRTDCALPMVHALRSKLDVDAFVVITDNETWAGNIHPSQALQAYRRERQIPAKLCVIGMTATGFSIADPKDAGMMDVVGFDSAAPALIADFIRN